MAKQTIGIGTVANDGTGDPLRTAMDKANDNFDELYPLTGQTFSGTISLTRYFTQYNSYTVATNIVITAAASPIVGGGAQLRLVANGTNTPDLTAFTKLPSSEDWDVTVGKIHLTTFYYDGTTAMYSHSILN